MTAYLEYGFKDRVAIVTGGGSGIGETTAIELAKGGAKVAVFGRRKDKIERVKEECEKHTAGAMAFSVDVAEQEQVQSAVKQVLDGHGRVDILVNNAGIELFVDPESGLSRFDDFFDTFEPDEYLSYFKVHSLGHYNMNRAVVPTMTEQHFGRVVCVTSILGITAVYSTIAYSASKAAAAAQCRGYARRYGPHNITFNSVLPGMTRTPMKDDSTPAEYEAVESMTPLGRVGDPIDVARVILFLAQENLFVTGQSVIVSGGLDIF
ncbi:MAG: SDR family oxidoreductase [Clostridiales bacterium]|nr:SDR family oxidoreductase [Clostridiales bacterium]